LLRVGRCTSALHDLKCRPQWQTAWPSSPRWRARPASPSLIEGRRSRHREGLQRRSFSGHERVNYAREAGTDARKVAVSQQIVRKGCPGRRTLDQESRGSSPGGAIKPGNDLDVVGLCLSARYRSFAVVSRLDLPGTPKLLRSFHYPQHRRLVGLLVAREKRVGVSPAPGCFHVNQREVLPLVNQSNPASAPES
jgi:hypothetical protein